MSDRNFNQRALGAVLGSAVGDALGAPFEFGPAGQYSARFPEPVRRRHRRDGRRRRLGWAPRRVHRRHPDGDHPGRVDPRLRRHRRGRPVRTVPGLGATTPGRRHPDPSRAPTRVGRGTVAADRTLRAQPTQRRRQRHDHAGDPDRSPLRRGHRSTTTIDAARATSTSPTATPPPAGAPRSST